MIGSGKIGAIVGLVGMILSVFGIGNWSGHVSEKKKQDLAHDQAIREIRDQATQNLASKPDWYELLRTPENCSDTNAASCKVTVFFATDRKPTGDWEPAKYFSGERNPKDELIYGVCQVSIPSIHRVGHLESPLLWFEPNPAKDVVLMSLAVTKPSDFYAGIHSAVQKTNGEALVFIHGYNVPFEEAARRAAQITWDLHFEGVPILYSWPSGGSIWRYSADEASAAWTADHLQRFLADVAQKSGAKTIHVVAHSLGNRALIAALQQVTSGKGAQFKKVHQIILAAPDIDAGVFHHLAAVFPSVADHVTIYASSHDLALRASGRVHAFPSIGSLGTVASTSGGVIDMIDASVMGSDLLDHSYFAGNVAVLEDMGFIIREGLPPARRILLDPKPNRASPLYWVFRR